MATLWDVLTAMAHVRDCTGDVMGGLTADEVSRVNVALLPEQADLLIANIRQRHPTLFDASGRPITPPDQRQPGTATPDQQEGEAAQAMQAAEADLSRVHTTIAEFDRQMIEAILQARKTSDAGRASLDQLERDIENAVKSRQLDTALGAREFQSYLIGKLAEIIAVIGDANDSDESKRALAAALASLYAAQEPTGQASQPDSESTVPSDAQGTDTDPYESWPEDDTGIVDEGAPVSSPAESSATPAMSTPSSAPAMSTPSSSGWPSFGSAGVPSASPTPSGLSLAPAELGRDAAATGDDDAPLADEAGPDDDSRDDSQVAPEPAADTTVTLPDGETATAASPQLARVVQAAVDGTPIAEAFCQQGLTIPPAGTAVADPIDPGEVRLGDIGMFTDRHALAVSDDKALLDGQIQRIANVVGPSFLGWQHPPPAETAPPPTPTTETPTPTRPSAALTT